MPAFGINLSLNSLSNFSFSVLHSGSISYNIEAARGRASKKWRSNIGRLGEWISSASSVYSWLSNSSMTSSSLASHFSELKTASPSVSSAIWMTSSIIAEGPSVSPTRLLTGASTLLWEMRLSSPNRWTSFSLTLRLKEFFFPARYMRLNWAMVTRLLKTLQSLRKRHT